MIPLGQWAPDLPARDNPGATVAKNVTPEVWGYGPWRALGAVTDALAARCIGAASAKAPDGAVLTVAGTTTRLYRLNSTSWSDVTKGATPVDYTAGTRWRFQQFDNLLIATNYADSVQVWTLGSSSAFSDLGTNCPKARYAAVVGRFLLLANIDDSVDGEVPNRVAWGPINDPTGDWTPSQTTQADRQDLQTGGHVTGLVGGDVGYVLCEDAIYRISYAGPPIIFEFDRISENQGCISPGTVATDGRRCFFRGQNGFYMLDMETSQIAPIGANKVDDWWLAEVSDVDSDRISAAVSPEAKLYIVSFPSGDNGEQPDRILIYNWEAQMWSYAVAECDQVVRVRSAGYTLEQLDNISSSIDALAASLDSNQWKGGDIIFGAFTTSFEFGAFGGDPLDAVIETAEAQLFDPQRALVHGVRPIVDGGTWTVQLGYRDLPTSSVTWGTAQSTNSMTGMANFHKEARYHRARLNGSGTWTKAQGIDVEAEPAGYV